MRARAPRGPRGAVGVDRPAQGRDDQRRPPRTAPTRRSAERDPVAEPLAAQQVDRAQGQDRHVEDAAEQVEDPEAPRRPAVGRRPPERSRPQGEHGHGQPSTPARGAAGGAASARRCEQAKASATRVAAAAKAVAVTAWHGGEARAPDRGVCDFVHKLGKVAGAMDPQASPAARPRPGARVAIPEATVARLPVYLRILLELAEQRTCTVSSRAAGRAGRGQRGQGPQGPLVPGLLRHPGRRLRRRVPAVPDAPGARPHPGLARRDRRRRQPRSGAGQLRGLRRPRLPGRRAGRRRPGQGGHRRRPGRGPPPSTTCRPSWPRTSAVIGVIATPAAAAQDVADRLVEAGVTAILNFAPALVSVPPRVSLRKVDLALELQILSFYQSQREREPTSRPRAAG